MSSCKKYFLIFSLTCLVVQAQARITGSKAETKTDASKDTKLPPVPSDAECILQSG